MEKLTRMKIILKTTECAVQPLEDAGYVFLDLNMRVLRSCLNLNALLSFYFAHVESRLSYGICFWGSSPALCDVLLSQKRVVRSMADLGQSTLDRDGGSPLECVGGSQGDEMRPLSSIRGFKRLDMQILGALVLEFVDTVTWETFTTILSHSLLEIQAKYYIKMWSQRL
ncbi:hypothetical protein C0J52_24289 [Blattella germanica]|nr:hypothetical protein C0J52_24289 [Blattella germanica]